MGLLVVCSLHETIVCLNGGLQTMAKGTKLRFPWLIDTLTLKLVEKAGLHQASTYFELRTTTLLTL